MACCPVGFDRKISVIHSFMYSSAAILPFTVVLYILKVDDEVVRNLNRKSSFLWIIK